MQSAWVGSGDEAFRVDVPAAGEHVLPGIAWGRGDVMNTPAYWAIRCRWPGESTPDFVSSTGSLIDETAFCILGGFGIRYEANAAAFSRLKEMGAFDPDIDFREEQFREALTEPLNVEGRPQRYRFPNQRARRLASMKERLRGFNFDPCDPTRARSLLMTLDGVGPKTASWIVRNLTGSDEVAIIDVHVVRACSRMGVFPDRISLPRDYDAMERRFLAFADAISIRASVLDAVMWTEMRAA